MSEEVSPTFKKCLIKKSKLYYKTEAVIIGVLIIGISLLLTVCWALITFQLNSSLLLLIALDIIVIGTIVFGIVIGKPNPVEEFVKLFIALHVFIVVMVILFLIDIIAYFICPVIVTVLVGSVLTKFDTWIMLIGVGIALIIILPVNHAMFECSKIDPWVNKQIAKVGELLGEYTCLK